MRAVLALIVFLSFNAFALPGVFHPGNLQLDIAHSSPSKFVFRQQGEDGTTFVSCDGEQFSILHSVDGYGGKMEKVTAFVSVLNNGANYLNKVDKDFDINILYQILNDKDVHEVIVITDEGEDSFINHGISQDLYELGGTCQNSKLNQNFVTKF